MPSTTGRSLFVLILVLIIDLLSFTCILPLFPSILDGFAKSETRDELYLLFESFVRRLEQAIGVPNLDRYNNVFLGGVLGSLFSLLQYLSSPVLGALSDFYGRKPILVASIIGSLASYYIWSVANTFAIFVVSRVVGGFSKASVSISIAIVSDLCTTRERGRGMALVGIAFSVAFILGPMIGAYFSVNAARFGADAFMNPPRFAILLTLVELVIVLACLPETLKMRASANNAFVSAYNYVAPHRLFRFAALQQSLRPAALRQISAYSCVYFFYLLFYSALEFTLSFYTHIRFNYDSMQQGRMYFFVGLLMIVVQGGYVRRIQTQKHAKVAAVGLMVIVPAYLLISLAESQGVFYLGLCLYAVASAIVVPCLTTLVSELSPESEKGVTMGIFRSLGALSRACGPFLGSFTFWLIGPKCCYAFGAVLFVVPLVMLRRVSRSGVALASDKRE